MTSMIPSSCVQFRWLDGHAAIPANQPPIPDRPLRRPSVPPLFNSAQAFDYSSCGEQVYQSRNGMVGLRRGVWNGRRYDIEATHVFVRC